MGEIVVNWISEISEDIYLKHDLHYYLISLSGTVRFAISNWNDDVFRAAQRLQLSYPVKASSSFVGFLWFLRHFRHFQWKAKQCYSLLCTRLLHPSNPQLTPHISSQNLSSLPSNMNPQPPSVDCSLWPRKNHPMSPTPRSSMSPLLPSMLPCLRLLSCGSVGLASFMRSWRLA